MPSRSGSSASTFRRTTLADRARVAFMEIRNEMRTLAPLVAKEKGLSVTDYRDVIRELKKNQLVGEAILPHYQKRMRDLEEIIRREGIVTLPTREARIRLASEAESAAIPAPNMRPPRLIGNTGEMGEFVLPLRVPTRGQDGKPDPQGLRRLHLRRRVVDADGPRGPSRPRAAVRVDHREGRFDGAGASSRRTA